MEVSEEQVLEAFAKSVSELRADSEQGPEIRHAQEVVADPTALRSVTLIEVAALQAQLERVHGVDNVDGAMLIGSISNLSTQDSDSCWQVSMDRMMGGGVGGCVAQDGSAVLAVWVIPEG